MFAAMTSLQLGSACEGDIDSNIWIILAGLLVMRNQSVESFVKECVLNETATIVLYQKCQSLGPQLLLLEDVCSYLIKFKLPVITSNVAYVSALIHRQGVECRA